MTKQSNFSKISPEPGPEAQVKYFQVHTLAEEPPLLIREVDYGDGTSRSLQIVDKLGVWRANSGLVKYFRDGDAGEISMEAAEALKEKYFSMSMREFAATIKKDLEDMKE